MPKKVKQIAPIAGKLASVCVINRGRRGSQAVPTGHSHQTPASAVFFAGRVVGGDEAFAAARALASIALVTVNVTGFDMTGRIDHAGFDDLTLTLGSGIDHLNIANTIAGATHIETGDGADDVKIETYFGDVEIGTGLRSDPHETRHF